MHRTTKPLLNCKKVCSRKWTELWLRGLVATLFLKKFKSANTLSQSGLNVWNALAVNISTIWAILKLSGLCNELHESVGNGEDGFVSETDIFKYQLYEWFISYIKFWSSMFSVSTRKESNFLKTYLQQRSCGTVQTANFFNVEGAFFNTVQHCTPPWKE